MMAFNTYMFLMFLCSECSNDFLNLRITTETYNPRVAVRHIISLFVCRGQSNVRIFFGRHNVSNDNEFLFL